MRVGGGEEGWSGDVSGVLTAAITAAAWAMGIDATVLGVLTGRNLPGKCSWRPEGTEPARQILAPGQARTRASILRGRS